MRQVILDTETTGLSVDAGHRIIEIGCIELINRRLTGKQFHYYLNPEREVDKGAFEVHGLSNEFLSDKPKFSQIVDEFCEFVVGAELIIHNATFDIGFLDNELKLVKNDWRSLHEHCKVTDTLALARKIHIGQRNNLDALCKRYNIDNASRDLHGALLDAHLLAQVYLMMTGGQTSMFDANDTSHQEALKKVTVETSVMDQMLGDFKVVFADYEEIKAHKEKLTNMHKSGSCLWIEIDSEAH